MAGDPSEKAPPPKNNEVPLKLTNATANVNEFLFVAQNKYGKQTIFFSPYLF